MPEVPKMITCPSGHCVPVTDVHSVVSLLVKDIDDAITFDCPGGKRGHTFTLRKAVRAKTFTDPGQIARLRKMGEEHRKKYQ